MSKQNEHISTTDEPEINDPRKNLGNIARTISTGLASVFTLVYTMGRTFIGSTAYLAFGTLNILRNMAGAITGVLAEGLNLGRKSIGAVIGVVAEGFNIARKGISAVVGVFAEGLNLARQTLGVFVASVAKNQPAEIFTKNPEIISK